MFRTCGQYAGVRAALSSGACIRRFSPTFCRGRGIFDLKTIKRVDDLYAAAHEVAHIDQNRIGPDLHLVSVFTAKRPSFAPPAWPKSRRRRVCGH